MTIKALATITACGCFSILVMYGVFAYSHAITDPFAWSDRIRCEFLLCTALMSLFIYVIVEASKVETAKREYMRLKKQDDE